MDALAWAVCFTRSHRENFAVLSWFLPRDLRPGFAAVYAFCRTADDLADGHDGSAEGRAAALDALGRTRDDLDATLAGRPPGEPLWRALAAAVDRYGLPAEPFHRLLDAFEQDQRVTRYATLEQVLGYCRGSADPVGRLVLALSGADRPDRRAASDATCTALQLINHWQDVRRDLLERDRIYLPEAVAQRHGFDHAELADVVRGGREAGLVERYAGAVRELCDDAATRFEAGRHLADEVGSGLRRPLRLFTAGGEAVLQTIRAQKHDTLTRRARVPAWRRTMVLAGAMLAREGRR